VTGRRINAGILLATVAAVALWGVWHPPILQHPDSDLYEHLSVARHLAAGDGFLNDIAYPLSYAFPFAARIPQPLIHRPPGYPLWLTIAVAAGGGDPERTVGAARWLTAAALAGIVLLGLLELRRRSALGAAALWLPLLLTNPLTDMTVRWCQVEVVTALLLTAVWLRGRGGRHRRVRRHGALTGVLCGLTALMRPELTWLPWLWLAVRRPSSPRRWWIPALLAFALTTTPWLIRNTVLTGNPVFSLQAHAEHLKNTPEHPGMSSYMETEPETLFESLERAPEPILRKAVSGLRYQAARADNWIPWPLAVAAALSLVLLRRRPGTGAGLRPFVLLAASWAALAALYAPFSHDLRHMAVLLPVILLELSAITYAAITGTGFGRSRSWTATFAAAGLCLAIVVAGAPRMPGWERARNDADALWLDAGAALARTRTLPPGPIVTDHGAVFWMSGRAGMIRPEAQDVLHRLRAEVPGLDAALVVHGATGQTGGVN